MKPGDCPSSRPRGTLLVWACVAMLGACADKPLQLAQSSNTVSAELQAQRAARPASAASHAATTPAAAAAAVPLPSPPPRNEAASEVSPIATDC